MKPLISFCIPTYNRASLLEKTLYSIISNIENAPCGCEIIVSDNASNDETTEIASHFKQQTRFRYICNESNIGPGRNLAHAIAKAHGEYVWMLGDDDPLVDGIVSHLSEMLQSHSELDYIFVPRKLMFKDLSPHPLGIQPSGIHKDIYFENGYQLFGACNGQIPGVIGFYGCNLIRRQIWLDSLAELEPDYTNMFHMCTVLNAIKNRPSAIVGRVGVLARINTAPEVIDSKVWIDYFLPVFLKAIEWGYSRQLCESTIKKILRAQAKLFVLDKAEGKRDGNLLMLARKLNCEKQVNVISFWAWISFLPRIFLIPLLWIRALRRKLRRLTTCFSKMIKFICRF